MPKIIPRADFDLNIVSDGDPIMTAGNLFQWFIIVTVKNVCFTHDNSCRPREEQGPVSKCLQMSWDNLPIPAAKGMDMPSWVSVCKSSQQQLEQFWICLLDLSSDSQSDQLLFGLTPRPAHEC